MKFEAAGIHFEWDEIKAIRNLEKHGIDFRDAARIFFDPYARVEPSRVVRGEERLQAIGRIDQTVIVLVAFTERRHGDTETTRIISARKARTDERSRYLGLL